MIIIHFVDFACHFYLRYRNKPYRIKHFKDLFMSYQNIHQPVENHYGDFYFSTHQKEVGEFAGVANLYLFRKSIKTSDTVLDFGCGGGFILKNLHCANKIGVEVNPVARNYCNEINKIKCYASLSDVPDESIDVIISNHCLEHVTSPYEIIIELYKKLKPGGRIILVVPLDSYRCKWAPNDINNHLYSFSPMNLGNLLQDAGFKEIKAKALLYQWPPFYRKIASLFGHYIFHQISWIYGSIINRKWAQTRAEGVK